VLNPYWNVEVWKCSAESDDVDEPSCHVIQEAKPTDRQLTISAIVADKYGTSPSRGNFLPWAHLQRPGLGGVTRFSFPFVVVTTSEEIYIWDVRTGALVQTMLNIQQVNYEEDGGAIVTADDDSEEFWFLGEVSDINLTERYVFVCGTESLRIFDRSVGGVAGMGRELAVSAEDLPTHDAFGTWCFTVATDDSDEVIQKHKIEGALVVEHETVLSMGTSFGDGEFLAGKCLDGYVFCRTQLYNPSHMASCPIITVYISSCGSHAAILFSGSRILVKPYFKDGYEGRIPPEWNMFEIDLSPFDCDSESDEEVGFDPFHSEAEFTHLAFDNGRIAVPMV